MIEVAIWYTQQNDVEAFKVTGHACYAEKGSDIVCAAVSAIVQTAILGVGNYLNLPLNLKIQEGYIECTIPDYQERQAEAEAILATMMMGLRELSGKYGKYITIREHWR